MAPEQTGKYPPAMLRFIERHLEKVDQNILRDIVNKSIKAGTMNTTDWDNYKIPKTTGKTGKTEGKITKGKPSTSPLRRPPPIPRQAPRAPPPAPPAKPAPAPAPAAPKPASAPITATKQLKNDHTNSVKSNGFSTGNGSKGTKRKAETDEHRKVQRKSRFAPLTDTEKPYLEKASSGAIIGKSKALEKDFYRLTGPVNPEVVRTPSALGKAFDYVKNKFSENKNYDYIRNQLQSIRQDLTVQHIEGALCQKVYDYNTTIALENDDLGEFNKCLQASLELRSKGNNSDNSGHPVNGSGGLFTAYNLLYMLRFRRWDHLSAEEVILTAGSQLLPELRTAISVVHAVCRNDRRQLFSLNRELSPNCQKLMKPIIKKEQLAVFAELIWACRSLPSDFIQQALDIESNTAFQQFLAEKNIPSATVYNRDEHYDSIFKALTLAQNSKS